jgi:hypothetical protein
MHSQLGPRDFLQQKGARGAAAVWGTHEKTVPKMFGISGKKNLRQKFYIKFQYISFYVLK